jgi:hypothetical protein
MRWMMTESSTRKQAIFPTIACEHALSGRASYSVVLEPVFVCVPVQQGRKGRLIRRRKN